MLDSLHILLITIIVAILAHQIRDHQQAEANKKRPQPTAESLLPASQFLDFLLIAGKTKQEKRTGWVNHDIHGAESIADHMYRMALMALFIRDGTINNYQAAHVALLHDFSESIVGDITPPESSGVSVDDKHRMELEAVQQISEKLIKPCTPEQQKQQKQKHGHSHGDDDDDEITPPDQLSVEFQDLYNQYNNQTTEEGKFCKQLDKLEMVIQAYEYELLHPEKDLTTFYNSGKKGIKHPYLLQLQDEVLKRREVMLAERKAIKP